MAYDDNFRELIENARDAVSALLDDSSHDSWLEVRSAYGDLCQALEADKRKREGVASKPHLEVVPTERQLRDQREQEEWRERNERREAWKKTPMATRESLLLHALGEDRLPLKELTERLVEEFKDRLHVYDGDVRSVAVRMFNGGQLDRVSERFRGTQCRYRYFRKRGLEGPIAGLEQAYKQLS